MRVLVIENDPISGPGLIGETLQAHGAVLDPVRPHHGDGLPADLGGHDAVLILGGPQHAMNDQDFPAFPAILDLLRQATAEDKPVMGICLGAQLLARAFGGRVYPMGGLEVGLPELSLTDAAGDDAVLAGLGPHPRIMQWHEDTFDLPDQAVRLMTGTRCRNQSFRVGRATYAFQCHPEAGLDLAGHWLDTFWDGPFHKHFGEAAKTELARTRQEVAAYAKASEPFAHTIAARWRSLSPA